MRRWKITQHIEFIVEGETADEALDRWGDLDNGHAIRNEVVNIEQI